MNDFNYGTLKTGDIIKKFDNEMMFLYYCKKYKELYFLNIKTERQHIFDTLFFNDYIG